jgi:hypothetical protein
LGHPPEIGGIEPAFHHVNFHQQRSNASSTSIPTFEHSVILGAAVLQNGKSSNPERWPLLDAIRHLIAELSQVDLLDLHKALTHKKAMCELQVLPFSAPYDAMQGKRVFAAPNPGTTQTFERSPMSETVSTSAVRANSTSAFPTSTASPSTTTTTSAANFFPTGMQSRNLRVAPVSLPIMQKIKNGEGLGLDEITEQVDSLKTMSSPAFSKDYIESLRLLVRAVDEGNFPELKLQIP